MKFGRKASLTCSFSAALLLGGVVYGQSLGDVARQQRAQQQQQEQSQTQPTKVLTNDDLPNRSDGANDLSVVGPNAKLNGGRQRYSGSNSGGKLPAEQWKSQILAMKNNIATIQRQIDDTKASVRFVQAPIYSNGVRHNQQQEQKLEQVERAQGQLDSMKRQLEEAQEEARKQGYGSSIYDP
jgi:hypothetical protein